MAGDALLRPWIERWRLTPDGDAVVTGSTASRVQLVRTASGEPAILKLATSAEERRGAKVMAWWNGEGAARVLAFEGEALLLERLEGEGELQAMAQNGADDAATAILCDVAMRLHRPPDGAVELAPLDGWFAALRAEPRRCSPDPALFADAAHTAEALLAEPRSQVVLHGDIHHGNAMRGRNGEWLAIDPKGLVGEACYDFANILNNPNAAVAHAPGRLGRQARVIAGRTGQPLARVLQWAFAYAALSAAWSRSDGREDQAALALTTARIAQAELASAA